MIATTYITRFAILSLWAAALFDPAGSILNLKYIGLLLFGFALLINILTNRLRFKTKEPVVMFFVLFIFLQICGLFTGALRGGLSENFIDTSYIYSSIYFSFVFLLFNKSDFVYSTEVLLKCCALIGALILAAYAFATLGFAHFNSFFLSSGLAYISERDYGGVAFPYIYFIVSPILVFGICKSVSDVLKKFSVVGIGKLLFFIASLSLTGTRMNIAFSLLSVLLAISWLKFGRIGYLYVFASSVIAFFALTLADIGVINSFFDVSEANNNTKLGYLPYYWTELSIPATLLFGQGFNAHSWSSELQAFLAPEASKLELTYLELIRVFGAPLGILFIVSVFSYLLSSNPKRSDPSNWVHPASISYLIMASLNPYLFSLDGMMVLATAFAYRYHSGKAKTLVGGVTETRVSVERNVDGAFSK